MPYIKRKFPTKFSRISWGGPKTGSRAGIAKHLRKMRNAAKAHKEKYRSNMLTSIRGQRDEVKARIKAARPRLIYVRGKEG